LSFTTGIVAEFHPASLWAIFLHVVIAELPVAHLVEVLAGVNDFFEVFVMFMHTHVLIEILPLSVVPMEIFRIKKKIVASHLTTFNGHLTVKLFHVVRIVAIGYIVSIVILYVKLGIIVHILVFSAPPALFNKFILFIFGHRLTIELGDVSPIVGNEFGTLHLGLAFKSCSDVLVF